MLLLLLRSCLLIPTLIAASLVFADELVVTALILITVTLAAVSLVIGPDDDAEHVSTGTATEAEIG